MPSGSVGPVAVLGVLAYILWSTLQARSARTGLGVPLVLIVVGGVGLFQYLAAHTLSPAAGATLTFGSRSSPWRTRPAGTGPTWPDVAL